MEVESNDNGPTGCTWWSAKKIRVLTQWFETLLDVKDKEDLRLMETVDVFLKGRYGVNRSDDGLIDCL